MLDTAGSEPPSPADLLRLSEREIDGGEALVVENAFYELTLRPGNGATISSLRFGVGRRRELTFWNPLTPAGLLQETHTADVAFKLADRETNSNRIVLAFEGGEAPLEVRKVFEFQRDNPCIKVTLFFENRSPFALGGAAAPGVSSMMLPADGKATGREYYCLDRGRGAEAITSAAVLAQLNPLPDSDDVLNWLAVTEAVTRMGLGVAFLDDAARHPSAQRNPDGTIMMHWRYGPIPAHGSLRAELLLVPLQGFAAVSALNSTFVADTVAAGNAQNGLIISLQLMPLRSDMADVSITTRAYRADGTETQPFETLLFESIAAGEQQTGKVVLPPQADTLSWLQHELYQEGKKVGQFAVSLSPNARPLSALKSELPPAQVEAPTEQAIGQADDYPKAALAAERYGFVVRRLQGELVRPDAGPLYIALTSGEKETLFFGISAPSALERLRVSIAAAAEEALPISPTAAYLWSVRQGAKGSADMVPFEECEVQPGGTVWIAVTFDASELAPGRHAARLFIEGGNGEPFELPIVVDVSAYRLSPSTGFALWFVDTDPSADDVKPAVLLNLSVYTVSALSLPLRSDASAKSLASAESQAQACRLDMLGFYAPGGAVGTAERTVEGGLLGAAFLPAPKPGWLLWSGSDDLTGIQRLRELGFEPAVALSRLPEPTETQQGEPRNGPKHWLVEAGCALGAVPALVQQGRIRPEDSVWIYLDLCESDWVQAAAEVRSAFWAAAWQGLAGAAVRCPQPPASADRQSVLWHILRDAREEAALAAEALQEGDALLNVHLEGERLNLNRAGALEDLRTLVGWEKDCLVRIESERLPFRNVLRARAGRNPPGSSVAGFHAAKRRALTFHARAQELLASGEPTTNLYWRGVPLLENGQVCWAIVATGTGRSAEAARALQKRIEARAGGTIPILGEFPDLEAVGGVEQPRLIWLITDEEIPESLPQAVRDAAAAAGDGLMRVVETASGTAVAVLGAQADLQALERSFLTRSTLYRRASDVK